MEKENNAFSFSYSGAGKEELEYFKVKYMPGNTNEKIKKMRAYDKNVDLFSTLTSVIIGLIGSVAVVYGTIFIIKEQLSDLHGAIMLIAGLIVVSFVPVFHGKVYAFFKSIYTPRILSLIKEIEKSKL